MRLRAISYATPESRRAAARVLAMLLARDGRIAWRELDLLERMGTFEKLGIEPEAFAHMAESIFVASAGRGPEAVFEPEFQLVDSRPLQLLICSLLVHIVAADGEVAPEESALVRKAFLCWNVSPEALRREMHIPVHRTLAALAMLPEAA